MAEAKKKKAQAKPKQGGGGDRYAAFKQSEVFAKLKKKYKKDVLEIAEEHEEPEIRRIPFNNFPLDYATGGGIPAGCISLIWGGTSSGKTTAILRALAGAQLSCANCYGKYNPVTGEIGCHCDDFREPLITMINAEGTWDKTWAQTLGLDTSRLFYNEAESGEQAIDIAEALLRDGENDIIVIDSIAALTPTAEIEKSAEDVVPGGQARLINRAMRTLNSAMNTVGTELGRKPTLILINQLRHKLGVIYGSPDTMPGGFGQQFASSMIMKFWGGKFEMDSDTGKPVYGDFQFRVDKNKAGPPKVQGEYRLMLSDTETKKRGDVYDEGFILKLAKKVGYLEGAGAKWSMAGFTARSQSLIEKELLTNPEYSFKVRTEFLELSKEL